MTEEMTLIQAIVAGFIGIGMSIIGFFTKGVVSDVRGLKKDGDECKLNLANYKTEVSNVYAKDSTVQASLSRIHDRIDDVSTDIKTLLSRAK